MGKAQTTMGMCVIRVEGACPADVAKCPPCICDAVWTNISVKLELPQEPPVHLWSVPENHNGTGHKQAVSKSPSTQNQNAWVASKALWYCFEVVQKLQF